MQLIMAFLNRTTPAPPPPSQQLRDPKARAKAIDILTGLIANAAQPTNQAEAVDK